MANFLNYKSTPIGSITILPIEKVAEYNDKAVLLPSPLFQMLCSPKTGAFIRGELKILGLPTTLSPAVAFQLVRVCLGEINLENLSTAISEQSIPNEKAKRLALSIERELFSSTSIVLNAHLAQQSGPNTQENSLPVRPAPTTNKPSNQPSNVLDLKKDWRGPTPPSIKK